MIRRTVVAFVAVLSLAGMFATPAAADEPDVRLFPVVRVSEGSFNATFNVLSACGTRTTDNDYKAPAVPAFIAEAAAGDRVAGMTRWSGELLTANGLPMAVYVKAITRTYYYPDGTFAAKVAGIGHVWHAWVPAYAAGYPCTYWTKVESRDF